VHGTIATLQVKPTSCMEHALSCSEFIVSILALCDELSLTLPVSKKLQTVKIDYLEANASVDDTVSVLNTRRNELDYFDNQVFGLACDQPV